MHLHFSVSFFFYFSAEKDTLNVFVNGLLREEEVGIMQNANSLRTNNNYDESWFVHEQGEFVDVGTDTKWEQDGNHFNLSARTSGNKREGLVHTLTVNGLKIDEISINETI